MTSAQDPPGGGGLPAAVARMRHEVAGLALPFEVPGINAVRAQRDRVLHLLDGYLEPRLGRSGIPLVVVVGGPTGSGKSTLTNSLLGANVSQAGVLRPTTREPVVVHHPSDTVALATLGLLPTDHHGNGTRGMPPGAVQGWFATQAVADPSMPPGLVVIDSPDLDSRLESNRETASRLLSLADLWLFVTTGTNYADALSWDLLGVAADRRLPVAVVLNRLRPHETAAVRTHFATLLTHYGLAQAHVFTLPEASLVDERLPSTLMRPLRSWLEQQAHRDGSSARHTQQEALVGALAEAVDTTRGLADAAADQVVSGRRLHVDIESVFSRAREEVRRRCADGSLVTDQLLAAWRVTAPMAPPPPPGQPGQPGHPGQPAQPGQPSGPPAFGRARSVLPGTTPPAAAVPDTVAGGLRLVPPPLPSDPAATTRRRHRTSERQDEPYAAVADALHSTVLRLMREQVEQAIFRAAERWAVHPRAGGIEAARLLPPDFGQRVDAATLGWLAAVRRRVEPVPTGPAAHANELTGGVPGPRTLALATAALTADDA